MDNYFFLPGIPVLLQGIDLLKKECRVFIFMSKLRSNFSNLGFTLTD